MDTSEENSMDSAALYPDTGHASFYASKGVNKISYVIFLLCNCYYIMYLIIFIDALSPTSQLARLENRSSHTLQLMKASFFNQDSG